MVADEERQGGDQQQGPEAGTVEVEDGQQQRQRRRAGVEHVPAGQLLRLAVHLAGQLAEGDHRAGEGHRADEHAQHHLDLQEHQLVRCLGRHQGGEGGELVGARLDGTRGEHATPLEVGAPADEHRRQADEAVQRRHQLRHLGHVDLLGHIDADAGADDHHRDHPAVGADARAEGGEEHRHRHADDAVPHRPLGLLLVAQPPQGEDEQYTCRDRRGRHESLTQHGLSPRFMISGTWPASGVSPGSRPRY